MPLRGFYINLDRSEARRREVEAELGKLTSGDPYERFAAIDGRELDFRPEILNRSALACFLSHLEILKQNADFDGWLHVMEDDVVVSRHARSAIAIVTSDPQFDVYDIIFTNVRLWAFPGMLANLIDTFDKSVETAPSGDVTAVKLVHAISLKAVDFFFTTSYLVNPRAIGKIADLLTPHLQAKPLRQIDAVLSLLSRSGELSAACTMPFFTTPRLDAATTIQFGGHHWDAPLTIMDAMLFADRDVADLRRRLADLNQAAGPVSATSEIIAGACGLVIGNAF